jgi:hypothetical protein
VDHGELARLLQAALDAESALRRYCCHKRMAATRKGPSPSPRVGKQAPVLSYERSDIDFFHVHQDVPGQYVLEVMRDNVTEDHVRELVRFAVTIGGVEGQPWPLAVHGVGVNEVVVDRGFGSHNGPSRAAGDRQPDPPLPAAAELNVLTRRRPHR